MEKSELRAVIKYFHLKGLNQKQIIEEFQTVLREHAPSNATVYNWVNEFKRGRIITKDEPRSGRLKEVKTPETVEKVYKIVTQDRRIKLREIADIVNISYERMHNIIHDELGMKKLSARWVPRLLTPLQKMNRMSTSKVGLDMFNRNPSEFLRRFITMDETWIHHYTPESEEQSKHWVERGSSAPKNAKVTPTLSVPVPNTTSSGSSRGSEAPATSVTASDAQTAPSVTGATTRAAAGVVSRQDNTVVALQKSIAMLESSTCSNKGA
ncbi:uncharacterized protein LOC129248798 [Anastrepha obliqua]|uniref:uncharacterized protein LOC129248798 n=1 Tax=Anastrepha obliqua TaxID=95512 RepID=UPI00240A4D5E|nr:uncharacterized protein LOC129248798 [Anastrepha obliqua]